MTVKVSRILHAGYLFECAETKIAFDPIFENPFSRNCYAFPAVRFDLESVRRLKLSAVFISHYHDDHCSLESLQLLDRATPIYMFCLFDEMFALLRELGFANVYPLVLNGTIHVGPFAITPRRALDEDVDSIFHIQAEGVNILNVVDSWLDPDTLTQLSLTAPWDLVLWPFQTMRELEVISPRQALPATQQLPAEWIEQIKMLRPRFVVPSSCQFIQESWSWYNRAYFPISYRLFQQEIENALPETQVVRMNPGTGFLVDKHALQKSQPLEWVIPIGDQNVDYSYEPGLKAPPTSEVAKHFAPLSSGQREQVDRFLDAELAAKFKSLAPAEDPYFQSLNWRLKIYDDTGSYKQFNFRITGSTLHREQTPAQKIDWLTEVIATKLWSALFDGESLSSMYLRINDMEFPPETAARLREIDIVEDPLLRCLFNGVFGAYQKAQLRKIRASQGN